jgi:hypothetical protein
MGHDRLTKLLTKLLEIADACFRLGAVSAILLDLRGSTPQYSLISKLTVGLFEASMDDIVRVRESMICGSQQRKASSGLRLAGE